MHKPDEETRCKVESLSAYGVPQDDICTALGITKNTLIKHYRQELDLAAVQANARVAGKLFEKCMAGDTTSIIFWLKTRAKWKETHVHESTGKDGNPQEFIFRWGDDITAQPGQDEE